VDADQNKKLDFGELIHLLRLLRKRPEVEPLFYRYSNGSAYMTTQQLSHFLQMEQRLPTEQRESNLPRYVLVEQLVFVVGVCMCCMLTFACFSLSLSFSFFVTEHNS
jgi:Phosphoinositide-specific phospholipase C, efhand-like